MEKYICIHAHFYQPPRENPWLEEVEVQDSAYPYHDWNERITAECYAPNTASRILDPDGRIVEITNNYARISFNFGPTLLHWMELHKPEVYQAILEADKLSMERFSGHGSAIAQAYNHMIMPLANTKDKRTQIIWGIKDFQKRFGRDPEGMWLPETAVDMDTLGVMGELGIKFTILAPRQAHRVRKIIRGTKWHDVKEGKINPTTAYLCRLKSGRTINLFFYDGPISQEVAFSELLNNGEVFAHSLFRVLSANGETTALVHIATDGETYGHHHRHGDMALSYCLYYIESKNMARLTNYGEYLEEHPPTQEVEIIDNSSWSCIHGIERWREDCGCNSGMHPGWSQAWRKPLRESMDWLRDRLATLYESEASKYLSDPWKTRDDYLDVIFDRSSGNVEKFLKEHSLGELSRQETVMILKLLEMQRNAMLMYTSCGWFFDEISGLESTQVLQYAAKAIQLAEKLFDQPIEPDYLKILGNAPSNIPEHENGAKVYEKFVKPAMVDLLRVGAHYAISSLFDKYPESTRIYCYTTISEAYNRVEAGRTKLATGQARIISDLTWEEKTISFSVLHLGDHNIMGGVREFRGEEPYQAMQEEIKSAFEKGDIPEIVRLMDKHFGTHNYSLWHLFREEQRKILDQILQSTLGEIEVFLRQIYENNYSIMLFLQSLNTPFPKPLAVAAEHMINTELKRTFAEKDLDTEKLTSLINEGKRWSVEFDKTTLGFGVSAWINSLMEDLPQPEEGLPVFEKTEKVLKLLKPLSLELDLWKAQNVYFSIENSHYKKMKERAETGDDFALRWLEAFRHLGSQLHIKVS